MYKVKYPIGDFNSRPVFENWEYTQDAGAGNVRSLLNSFYAWAKIEPRSGSEMVSHAQEVWRYDAKVIVRYNANIVSSTTMVFQNARWTINSVSVDEDSKQRFQVLRCTKIDGALVTGGTITPYGPAYVFNYTGTGLENSTWTDGSLINKTVLGAFKDGVFFTTIYVGVPSAAEKEVLYTPSTGTFLWSVPYNAGEKTTIQYL